MELPSAAYTSEARTSVGFSSSWSEGSAPKAPMTMRAMKPTNAAIPDKKTIQKTRITLAPRLALAFGIGESFMQPDTITLKIPNSRRKEAKIWLKNALFDAVHECLAEFFADGDLFASDKDMI